MPATEEHLVEELRGSSAEAPARMAEAAVYREKLRHDATGYQTEHLVGAALLPLTGVPTTRLISHRLWPRPEPTRRVI
jgi:hypothetical protein